MTSQQVAMKQDSWNRFISYQKTGKTVRTFAGFGLVMVHTLARAWMTEIIHIYFTVRAFSRSHCTFIKSSIFKSNPQLTRYALAKCSISSTWSKSRETSAAFEYENLIIERKWKKENDSAALRPSKESIILKGYLFKMQSVLYRGRNE